MVMPGDLQVTPGFVNKGDLSAGQGSDRRSNEKMPHLGCHPPSSPVSPVTLLWLFQDCHLPFVLPHALFTVPGSGQGGAVQSQPSVPQAWHLLFAEAFLSQPKILEGSPLKTWAGQNFSGWKTSEMKY